MSIAMAPKTSSSGCAAKGEIMPQQALYTDPFFRALLARFVVVLIPAEIEEVPGP